MMFRTTYTSITDHGTAHATRQGITGSREARNQAGTIETPQRGVVAVQVLVLLVVLLGFAALTVDVGHLYNVKAELQNAADAAALAGASVFGDESLNRPNADPDPDYNDPLLIAIAEERALACAAVNRADKRNIRLDATDIIVGRFDWDNPDQPLSSVGRYNAVQVTASFSDNSLNGPVLNFFAGILGSDTANVSATGIAAMNDRVSGYSPDSPSGILPFTIDKDMYEDQMVNGPDNFEYDAGLDQVRSFPDDTPEIVLYPYQYWDSDADGSGNFGALNIGVDNQGASAFIDQILNGVSPEQFEAETGYSELTFADEEGNPTTYEITGNPGLAGGMESALETHIGNVVGFFLHTQLVNPGSNAVYTIVSIRFARVMEVDLTGSPATKRFVIQPVVLVDSDVITDPDAPGTDGMVGTLMIVR